MSQKRQLHLNLFINGAGHHQAAWRHPDSQPDQLFDLRYYIGLAQKAEAAKLDSIFFSDRLANRHQLATATIGGLEPFTLLSALAVHTQRIGLIATASTTYNQPYHVARKLAALDHISEGRAAWNIVTTQSAEESQNFGAPQLDAADLAQRAVEFVELTKKLFDSWDDDAPVYDKKRGIMSDASKVRPLFHKGEVFSVDGPLNAPRPVQGYPVLVQANVGHENREFAALNAEAVFSAQPSLQQAQQFYSDLKSRAAKYGRDRNEIKILPGLSFILGETEQAAREKAEQLDGLLAPQQGLLHLSRLLQFDLSGHPLDSPLPPLSALESSSVNQGRFRLVSDLAHRENLTLRQLIGRVAAGRADDHFVGTPHQLADHIEEWFTSYGADGFNLRPALLPGEFELFAEGVVPELQKRGLFRREYEGSTLREHLGLERPVNRYTSVAEEVEALAA